MTMEYCSSGLRGFRIAPTTGTRGNSGPQEGQREVPPAEGQGELPPSDQERRLPPSSCVKALLGWRIVIWLGGRGKVNYICQQR